MNTVTDTQKAPNLIKHSVSGSTSYDLNTTGRHKELDPFIEKSFKKLKKKIGNIIFSLCKIYGEKGNEYYLANKIYDRISEYENDEHVAFLGLDLKIELRKSSFHLMNTVIEREYSHILSLETENENLKRELEFYKALAYRTAS